MYKTSSRPPRSGLHAAALRALALAGAGAAAMALPPPAAAQTTAATATAAATDATATRRGYAIPAGPLQDALTRFGIEAGVLVSYEAAEVGGRRSAGLQGSYGAADGLATLLRGTGLAAQAVPNGFLVRSVPPAAADGATLPTVTVSATRHDAEALPLPYAGGQVARGARLGMLGNTDLMDAPFSGAAYTAATIEDQQARTVADVLANDPTVRFTTTAGHIYENYTVRGFDITSSELALNGMYGLAPSGHAPTEFIERVELLRGPTALLTGMAPGGAVGGVINLVPKRAGADPLTRLSTTYRSSANFGGSLDVSRRFGPDKAFGMRFNGAADDGRTGIDGQSKQRLLGALALDYAGERLRLSLDAYANRERVSNGSAWMASFTGPVIPAAPKAGTNILRGTHGEIDNMAVVGRGEFDLSDDWTVYGGVGTLSHRYAGFLNGTRANGVKPSGDYTGYTYNQRGFTDTLSAEAGVRGTARTGPVEHRLVLGFSFLNQRTGTLNKSSGAYLSNIYQPIAPPLAADPGSAPKTSDSTLTSFALADTLAFARDTVQLTLGLRQQRVQADTFAAATGARTASYDESAVTPALGLVLKPWGPGLSLFANYIEGLSQGDTVTDTAARNFGQMFAPYKTRQMEAGVKWDSGRLTQTLSVYQITRPSLVQDLATRTYHPDGERRHRGIEWNVFGEAARGVRVLGGVAYTRAVLTRTANGAYDGNTAFGTPQWAANLGTEWDLPWLPGLTLSGRATYTGTQYVNTANTQKIPAWWRFDAGARYITRIAGKRVGFYANVDNLFNESYWAGSFNDGYVTMNAPRTVRLTTTVDF
ncbi:TonB-dependent receptor [Cupriavidus malaysiensis]|uniref:TonB-dependent receptor n=1 Tax=Cupriavidus malaysiensis TaxID=367825 RepID=A0A1D9IDT9_9BURK|nr:TonB-dependent receptor [Cupriavidus malaysiensis]AOZ10145.1 TonB-dependent receptor [Cupriavidus malaysiensis]